MLSQSTSSSSATLGPQSLPPVAPIETSGNLETSPPVKRISTEQDTAIWMNSEAHSIYSLFVQRIAEACVSKPTQLPSLSLTTNDSEGKNPFEKTFHLLRTLNSWTEEIEPHSKPQRFGNLAFRDWGARLDQQLDQLHRDLLPSRCHFLIPELSAYLLDSFGSFVRIDYGSGHEFAFVAWLGFLYRLGFFDSDLQSQPQQGGLGQSKDQPLQPPTSVEEILGLQVFPLYLAIVWRLQDRYALEPAGSHGVWGLDDYQFLPYLFGAAQLRNQATLRPNQIVSIWSQANLPSHSPLDLLSFPVDLGKGVCSPNLYLTSLLRIHSLKRGPFFEHSPLLHDVSTSVPNWIKVYGGMVKMYHAECLGKRVVVQHFRFGQTAWKWDEKSGTTFSTTHPIALVSGTMSSTGKPTERIIMPSTTHPSKMGPPTKAPFSTLSSGRSTLTSVSERGQQTSITLAPTTALPFSLSASKRSTPTRMPPPPVPSRPSHQPDDQVLK